MRTILGYDFKINTCYTVAVSKNNIRLLATLSTRTQTTEGSGGQVSNFGTQASPSFLRQKNELVKPWLKSEP
jgi:hypothetical protein